MSSPHPAPPATVSHRLSTGEIPSSSPSPGNLVDVCLLRILLSVYAALVGRDHRREEECQYHCDAPPHRRTSLRPYDHVYERTGEQRACLTAPHHADVDDESTKVSENI